ncbi:hypothetical protein D3875_03575 [Deinococcus cavernae]|uniref:Uncharacterized protein n=1 Tax=Deinococcus cavernae TaxID=2320857 RepID=A0A418VEU3_9DEIO|nr:hypothetical protein D3875_03575 [Deinococcus cavernae]
MPRSASALRGHGKHQHERGKGRRPEASAGSQREALRNREARPKANTKRQVKATRRSSQVKASSQGGWCSTRKRRQRSKMTCSRGILQSSGKVSMKGVEGQEKASSTQGGSWNGELSSRIPGGAKGWARKRAYWTNFQASAWAGVSVSIHKI